MSNSGKVTNTVPSHPPYLSGVAQEPKQVKSTSRISVGPGGVAEVISDKREGLRFLEPLSQCWLLVRVK